MRLFETVDKTRAGWLLVNNAGILDSQMRLDPMSAATASRWRPMSPERSGAREAVRRLDEAWRRRRRNRQRPPARPAWIAGRAY